MRGVAPGLRLHFAFAVLTVFALVTSYRKYPEHFWGSLIISLSLVALLFIHRKTLTKGSPISNWVSLYLPLCNFLPAKFLNGKAIAIFGRAFGLLFTFDLLVGIYLSLRFRAEIRSTLHELYAKNKILIVSWVLMCVSILGSLFNSQHLSTSGPRSPYFILFGLFAIGVYRTASEKKRLEQGLVLFGASYLALAFACIAQVIWIKGLPFWAADFLLIKMDVPFMVHLGHTGYGNSAHLAIAALCIGAFYAPLNYLTQSSRTLRTLSFIVTLTSLFTILVLYSRTALFIYVVVNLFYLFFILLRLKRIPNLIIFSLLYIFLIHLGDTSIWKYFGGTQFDGDSSYVSRFEAMARGLELIRETGWPIGQGLGTYPIFDPKYTSPHNYILLIVFELGLLGIVGYLLMQFAIASKLIKRLLVRNSASDSILFMVSAIGLFLAYNMASVVAGSALFFDNILIQGYVFFGGLFIGLRIADREASSC